MQCNKVVLLSQASLDPTLQTAEREMFARNRPKWVVATESAPYIKEIENVLKKEYMLYARTDTAVCDIRLYRLNR